MSRTLVVFILLACDVCFSQLANDVTDEGKPVRRFVSNSRLLLGTESNYSASIRAGDFDGDKRIDIAVANGRHWPQQNYVLLNRGTPAFSIMRPLGPDRLRSYACEPGDLDGDGDVDLISGNELGPCKVFLNDGAGVFQSFGFIDLNSSVRSLALHDMDIDGDLDLLVTSRNQYNKIYLNDGSARFGNAICLEAEMIQR